MQGPMDFAGLGREVEKNLCVPVCPRRSGESFKFQDFSFKRAQACRGWIGHTKLVGGCHSKTSFSVGPSEIAADGISQGRRPR